MTATTIVASELPLLQLSSSRDEVAARFGQHIKLVCLAKQEFSR